MSRKPNMLPLPVDDGMDQNKLEAAEEAARQLGMIEAAQGEALQAGIAIGRLDAAGFLATVATSVLLASYESVKKTGAWKLCKSGDSGDGRHFESFDLFCQERYGKSYRRMRELSANRNLLGEELFEQAERIGLRQIDYNAIKALPAPRQEIVKEALTEGITLEEVQQRIQQLAADTQNEIEALEADLHEAKANSEAKDRLLSDKNQKIDELMVRNTPTAPMDWPKQYQGYVAQVQVIRNILTQNLANLDAVRMTVMANLPTFKSREEQTSEDDLLNSALSSLAWEMGTTLEQVTTALGNIQLDFDRTIGNFGES